MDNSKQPYVSNYPPLADWLARHKMVCQWQTRTMRGAHASMVEHYVAPNGRVCIVVVHANGNGWDLYTPLDSGIIVDSLDDAETRMGLPHPGGRS